MGGEYHGKEQSDRRQARFDPDVSNMDGSGVLKRIRSAKGKNGNRGSCEKTDREIRKRYGQVHYQLGRAARMGRKEDQMIFLLWIVVVAVVIGGIYTASNWNIKV